jgi:hypothetical protein
MQKYTTTQPGRTPPAANVVNREDYQLAVNLSEFRPGEYHLRVARYTPETGWATMNIFLTPDELESVRAAINGS